MLGQVTNWEPVSSRLSGSFGYILAFVILTVF